VREKVWPSRVYWKAATAVYVVVIVSTKKREGVICPVWASGHFGVASPRADGSLADGKVASKYSCSASSIQVGTVATSPLVPSMFADVKKDLEHPISKIYSPKTAGHLKTFGCLVK
jgi:hypothetical protein